MGTAPLHSRLVARALAGLMGRRDCPLQEARLFLELMRNGRTKWWKGQTVVVRAVGDASDRASVAFLPDCELGDQALPLIALGRVRLFHQRFSGTEGKVRTISHMLRWLHELPPTLLLYSRRLPYEIDSQAARFCVLGMKGANAGLEAVVEVYRLCAVTDTEIEVVFWGVGLRMHLIQLRN